ncbi:MAG: DNA polymerase/3'-5' exonuclease PolX [Actinobacteria bacterium]|nr:DNA polymerase/3'-5' exonuclease PolX [Actinomycetota bacterium]MBU1942607.1 DNA polymerase/3'-5' exonuclease PolX [Actinomycetota bacterium]MBU2688717.1 DNA polymerase/3'-5' exonuclease PolX [Actinomycetota bacterium]
MAVSNSEIAAVLDEVAALLEISGASFFRVRAYETASRVVRDLSRPVSRMIKDPDADLTELPGVGKDLASKITEIATTGDLPLRRELEEQVPTGLMDVTKIAGLGPRKAYALYLALGVTDLDSLLEAARSGKVKTVKGFGPKTEANILEGIYAVKGLGRRLLWSDAEPIAARVVEHMKALAGVERAVAAGSFRRLKDTVGDLDVLVVCADAEAAGEHFVSLPGVTRVIARGPTRSSVVVDDGVQVDIRVVEAGSWGSALQYFTGSQAHSIALRSMALRKGLKLNEYGVFREEDRVAGETEEDVYASLGLPWIAPELRENRGEISAAFEGSLPSLVELRDIRGDLHVHVETGEDGGTLAEIVKAARRKGYLYIAVTNRAGSEADGKALLETWKRIDRVNQTGSGLHVLRGVEVEILSSGTLALRDELLSHADIVVAAIHTDTRMNRPRMTRRVIKAMSHRHVDVLAHPTGRVLGETLPYQVSMDEVIAAAARYDVALELNACPRRLDIDDLACHSARDHGVKIVVATDAHSARELDYMRFGIHQARRGWLEKGDVLNTMTYRSLVKYLRHR